MPEELYAFIAEELFQSVPETLRNQLVQLALTPEMSPDEGTDLLVEDGERAGGRERLGDDADHPRWLETVRGVGYRMRERPAG